MSKHTETPWKVADNCYIESEKGLDIAETLIVDNPGEGEANAEHIVHCVNCHDDLVRVLREAFILLEEHQCEAPWYLKGHYNKLSKALEHAESEE